MGKKKPRGWWNTSLHDRARAQYQADQIRDVLPAQQPSAVAEQLNEAYRRGWADGRAALLAEQAQQRQ